MNAVPLQGLPLFFVLIPLMWILVTTLFALIAGHPRLLAQFPPVEEPHSFATAFASGRGPLLLNAGNALTVCVGERGLHFAFNGLFRPPWWRGIPCIPWAEVRYHGVEEGLFRNAYVISFPSAGARWRIYGAAGEAIAEALRTRGHGKQEP